MRIHVFRDNMILNPGPAPLRDLRPRDHDRAEPARPGHDGGGGSGHHVGAAEVYYEAAARKPPDPGRHGACGSAGSAHVRARAKSVVLVSEGFVYDTQLAEFKRLIDESRRRQRAATLLREQPRPGGDAGTRADRRVQHDLWRRGGPRLRLRPGHGDDRGPESLAADSGGFTVRNSNDLAPASGASPTRPAPYYLIGYNPTNTRARRPPSGRSR